MTETYKIITEVVRRLSHDNVTDVRIERVKRADIGPYSEGDWLILTDGEVTTHFTERDYINEDYIENWFDGFIESITQ